MATHSSILARRSPWTEEPGGLQSTGSQKVEQLTVFRPTRHSLEIAWFLWWKLGVV